MREGGVSLRSEFETTLRVTHTCIGRMDPLESKGRKARHQAQCSRDKRVVCSFSPVVYPAKTLFYLQIFNEASKVRSGGYFRVLPGAKLESALTVSYLCRRGDMASTKLEKNQRMKPMSSSRNSTSRLLKQIYFSSYNVSAAHATRDRCDFADLQGCGLVLLTTNDSRDCAPFPVDALPHLIARDDQDQRINANTMASNS